MRTLTALALCASLLTAPISATSETVTVSANVQPVGWQDFHSVQGKCSVSLPQVPEHVSQMLPVPEEGYNLKYDVYVSPHQQKAVYMMLIAQYPDYVDEQYADQGLESFLNGILSQNPNNQLVFADITEVQGHKALDFFIETDGVFFKGRAVMAQNNLYLLAMECQKAQYEDAHFAHFIESFKLHY